MRAEIIAVGSELLSFFRTETNSLRITKRLHPIGVKVGRKWVVSDQDDEIRAAFLEALDKSDVVAITGGLGPTSDDRTREVIASTLGRELRQDDVLLRELKKRYERFGLQVADNSLRQVMVPEGAEVIPNPRGTAPGLLLREQEKLVFLLPGPPRELDPMLDDHVVPIIQSTGRTTQPLLRMLKVAGEAESRVDHKIEPIYSQYPEIETTILSSPGVITLYFLWGGEPESKVAGQTLDALVSKIRDKLHKSVFTDREQDLAEVIGEELRSRSLTLATAESCTGGWLGKLLTDIPGSSDYFLGSIVCYSNEAKINLLGVEEELLQSSGAVSRSVAKSMALGVKERLSSDIGLSVTGVAGPGGGTEEKPVGTVYVGLALPDETKVRKLSLPGDREVVRFRTSQIALDWVRRSLT